MSTVEKHHCTLENAPKFADWIANRGGVAVWRSINLSNPGASWSSPALTEDGQPYPQPTWQADKQPERIITDSEEILVTEDEEVKRFRVGVRRCDQGLTFKLTDASSRKIEKAVEKAGEGAYYVFDYETQDAVIMKPAKSYMLKAWLENRERADA